MIETLKNYLNIFSLNADINQIIKKLRLKNVE